jgi:hypothetical protein
MRKDGSIDLLSWDRLQRSLNHLCMLTPLREGDGVEAEFLLTFRAVAGLDMNRLTRRKGVEGISLCLRSALIDAVPVDHPLEVITDQREWTLMDPLKECQEAPLPIPVPRTHGSWPGTAVIDDGP